MVNTIAQHNVIKVLNAQIDFFKENIEEIKKPESYKELVSTEDGRNILRELLIAIEAFNEMIWK